MTNNNKKSKSPLRDLLPLLIGEAIVVLLVNILFLILDIAGKYSFDYRIILGSVLGALVIIVNHAALIIKVDKEIKNFIELRGKQEMTEEEIEAFTKKHSATIQNAMTASFVVRTASIFITLILAFILDWFNPLATAIPMFAFRLIISAAEIIKQKKQPDSTKFVKYDFDDDKEEKEDI